VIAHELRGFLPVGGMGTATTFLALALARLGHSVEILLGKHSLRSIDPYWETVYNGAGVRVRPAPQGEEPVEPWHFVHPHRIELGLRADLADVVIAHDFGAPAYSALRLRQAGIAFENSLFVVFCHGTRRYVVDLSPNIALKDLRSVLGVSVLEQASVELADVVVSPSAYLLDWMRGQGWRLPERTLVIPYFTRSDATGETPWVAARPEPDPIRRFAFFGRVDEKKGLKTFAAALNALEPEELKGVEVEFIGRTTASWTRDRVEALLSEPTRQALRRVVFETELDQHDALARLSRPGTLAVMPSLQENSPNTVYECLEHGIPFIASDVGGVPELIAPDDRARVLFEPTSQGVEAAIRRVLAEGFVPPPARPALERAVSFDRWAEVIETQPDRRVDGGDEDDEGRVDVVVVHRDSREALQRCLAALQHQSYVNFEVVVATTRPTELREHVAASRVVVSERPSVEAARHAGLSGGSAPYVVFLDEDDIPHDQLLKTLLQARRGARADVATCGLRISGDHGEGTLHLFSGDPGGLGAVANAYGNVALFRRTALGDLTGTWPAGRDADWALFARLAASGASFVSVPQALVERRAAPGSVEDDPAGALHAVQQFEHALPDPLRGSARLVAGLAANARRQAAGRRGGAVARATAVLRNGGIAELAGRVLKSLRARSSHG
jgi:glycosyltransferase involved in cell wall biosynthesis